MTVCGEYARAMIACRFAAEQVDRHIERSSADWTRLLEEEIQCCHLDKSMNGGLKSTADSGFEAPVSALASRHPFFDGGVIRGITKPLIPGWRIQPIAQLTRDACGTLRIQLAGLLPRRGTRRESRADCPITEQLATPATSSPSRSRFLHGQSFHGRDMLQAILDSAIDAILTVSEEGTIASLNHATENLFGYPNEQLVGKDARSLFGSDDINSPMQLVSSISVPIAECCTGSHHEITAVRKDGSCFGAELTVSRVDSLPLFVFVIRDVSQRKELQTKILEIASDEQQRIGQELHDGTQQELTGLSLIAGTMEDFFVQKIAAAYSEPDELRLSIDELSWCADTSSKLVRGLEEANQHVQSLSHGIMPVQIDPQGLQSALAELANSTTVGGKVTCHFTYRGSAVVEDNIEATHLYRIAQEAVNNAQRHGKANCIHISLSASKKHIALRVSDDGIGMDLPALQQSGQFNRGMGLQIMGYRANVIGAKLTFSVGKDQETIVSCKIARHRKTL